MSKQEFMARLLADCAEEIENATAMAVAELSEATGKGSITGKKVG